MKDYLARPLKARELLDMAGRSGWGKGSDGNMAHEEKRRTDSTVLDDETPLDMLDGDMGILSELRGEFLRSAQADYDAMITALREGRMKEVRRLAHSFKSSAATVGAMQLSMAALLIEDLADAGDEEGTRGAMDGFDRAYGRAMEALRAWLGRP